MSRRPRRNLAKARRKTERVRRPPIRDLRGVPARRVPVHLAARRFGWMLYCLWRSGVFVVTRKGKPWVVLLDSEHFILPPIIRFAIELGRARRRNPGEVFTQADEIFGTAARTNTWMAEQIPSLGYRRPLELLDSAAGIQEVTDTLTRIAHGIFS